jgi:phytoene synthase
MTPTEALAICEATVRRLDENRYYATLFASAENRPLLFALYGFNDELARAGEMARDPVAAEIRLEWWREALDGARAGHPPAHPVAIAIAEVIARDREQARELEALIDARAIDSTPAPFATLAAMASYARATSARLMQMAARLQTAESEPSAIFDGAGIAYGLVGMLRNLPFHAARGRVFLPSDLLAAESIVAADVFSGKHSDRLKNVVRQVEDCALAHFRRAKQNRIRRAVLPAILPAALVPAYLASLAGRANDRTDILRLRKQLILLRAAFFRRL